MFERRLWLPVLLTSLLGVVWLAPASAQPEPASSRGRERDRTGDMQRAPSVPPLLLYLEQTAIRKELVLSAEQARKVDELLKEARKGDINHSSFDHFITNQLTAAQTKRLWQIVNQHRARELGMAAILAELFRDVKADWLQNDDLDFLRVQRAVAISKRAISGDRYEKIAQDVEGINSEHYDLALGSLTRTQQGRLKDQLGEPFPGVIRLGPAGPERKQSRPSVYLGHLFGAYFLELDYLGQPAIHAELELTAAQKHKASEALKDWERRLAAAREVEPQEDPFKLAADPVLSAFTELHLKDILTVAQRDRLQQIMIQRRRRLAGWEAACGHPAVQPVLKLTQVQIEQLRAGAAEPDVLTPAQAETLRKLAGKPFVGQVTLANPLVASEQGPVPVALRVSFPEFVLALAVPIGLTKEQSDRLRDMAEDEPKVRDLIQRELTYSVRPVLVRPGHFATPESVTQERFTQALEEQTLKVLDAQQRSMWEAKLKSQYRQQ